MSSNSDDGVFEALLDYLKQSRGFDFTGYKRSSLKRRMHKQMQTRQIETFGDYLDYLQVHPEEFQDLFNTILINLTDFFRDTSAWDYLREHITQNVLNKMEPTSPLRIWSAGCASGQEAYTLVMILAEILGPKQCYQRVKIYATDVDEDALNQARHGSYSAKEMQAISDELKEKYFVKQGQQFLFSKDLRRTVIFGRHDLVQDAPISRLDLLVCRNTLMYFNAETQSRILDRFHFALRETGVLFLGKAEMLFNHYGLFRPISLQHRVFGLVSQPGQRDRLMLPLNTDSKVDVDTLLLDQHIRLRELSFDTNIFAQLILDSNNYLILANTAAQEMFKLNLLDIGRPLQDLELSYRPLELRSYIDQSYAGLQATLITDVVHTLSEDQKQYLDIRISPLVDNSGKFLGVSITFADVTHTHSLQAELQQSNQDLETTNEELQSSNEELETTNEELQSTNEELETTNEELQSTNEELETMNEELQSTNEELQSINDELRLRTHETNRANAFLNSVLASLQSAVIVIDDKFHILSWNEQAEDLWGLMCEDVQGESLLDLDINLPVAQLRGPILNCLTSTQSQSPIVLDAIDKRGQSIQCQICFNPLTSYNHNCEGVILVMELRE